MSGKGDKPGKKVPVRAKPTVIEVNGKPVLIGGR